MTQNYIELKKNVKVKGQLLPLDDNGEQKDHAQIGILTNDGRKFYIHQSAKWEPIMWRHLWDFVALSGNLNYADKTIDIDTFYLGGQNVGEEYSLPSGEEYSNHDDTFEFNETIRKGDLIQPFIA